MQRIIFSNYDDLKNPYYGGGGALAVHEVAKRLAKDFEITILTGKYPGSFDETIDGVKYERIGTELLGPKMGQLVFQALLPFQARKRKFDLWVESLTPPFSTSFLPVFTKQPVIGLAHTLAAKDAARKYRLPFHLIENYGLKKYQHFIAVSDFVKQDILKANPNAFVQVIHNGVYLPKEESSQEAKHILFLGRIEIDQKGLDLLLKAYQKIMDKINLPLLIAGDGQEGEAARLQNLIRRFGLAGKVLTVGRVEGEEKARLLRQAAFAVVPSRFETFSLSALEALSYSLPVISFNISGLSWLPENAAIKVLPFNTNDLAQGMLKLVTDKKLRQSLGQQGRDLAKLFSWDKAVKEYKKVFENQLSKIPIDKGCQWESLTGLINKIIKQKIPCYFISPHLDDAALSAADLITFLAGKTNLTVVTIFTKPSAGFYTLSIKKFLQLHKYQDAEKMYQDRRAEDQRVWQELGVKAVHLGFTDALWRQKRKLGFASSLLGKVVPEFLYLYPTYRLHVISGRLHQQDVEMKQGVIKALQQIIPNSQESAVFCPAGFGGHVDHILTRQACEHLLSSASAADRNSSYKWMIFWKDATYRMTREDRQFQGSFQVLQWQNNFNRKQDMLYAYQSQVPQIFAAGKRPERFETYYIK